MNIGLIEEGGEGEMIHTDDLTYSHYACGSFIYICTSSSLHPLSLLPTRAIHANHPRYPCEPNTHPYTTNHHLQSNSSIKQNVPNPHPVLPYLRPRRGQALYRSLSPPLPVLLPRKRPQGRVLQREETQSHPARARGDVWRVREREATGEPGELN